MAVLQSKNSRREETAAKVAYPLRDLRDFVTMCETDGQLLRIKAEVNWDLELSHIAKLNEEGTGPVLLFENVKGYKTPVMTSAYVNPSRVAMTLGMSKEWKVVKIANEWSNRVMKGLIPPKKVSNGPVAENKMLGDKVDLLKFPVPRFYPKDGGRYFGTAAYLITKDPDTDFVNLGTYRMQVLDNNSLGFYLIKGKDAEVMLAKYREKRKPMPAAAIIGGPPASFLVSSTLVPYGTTEYNVIGALNGEPVEVIESDLTGLPIPAAAEIVVEGFINPEQASFRPEGPFGEYTGYYSGSASDAAPKPFMKVERILHRSNPIFWATTVGRPVTDTHIVQAINRSAEQWTQLKQMGIPGIKSVYIPPEMGGRYWCIISVKQQYPGHGRHAGLAVFGSVQGNYGMKGVIVVDDDIEADDIDRVLWALAVRYNPAEGTEILHKGRATPLDPSLPIGNRSLTSRILMDATIPYEWEKKPQLIEPDQKVMDQVKSRWKELGFQ